MRIGPARHLLVPLLLLLGAAPVGAKEVNPVQPELAKQLENKQTCLALAAEVGDRLITLATKTDAGTTIGEGPAVYGGDAGVALLFSSLYRADKKQKWLHATVLLLDQAFAAKPKEAGLYTGRAGIGHACLDAYRATGKERLLKHARACASPEDAYAATDVISGAAGTGIFLLNLHSATGDEKYLTQAREAGDYLVEAAVRKNETAHWPIAPGRNPRVYLGFSHGAAGIGYFLLHLGRRTKHAPYTDLAEEAARFVLQHEESEGEERAHWWRTVPKTSDFRRIQWCHGAPGIGLFFHDLHRFVPKKPWSEALERCLVTTRLRGRGARASACQCHGVTGNAELFLEVYAAGGEAKWLREARRSGSAIVVAEASGLRLPAGVGNAEYDASYMLGLAGIGHFFLRLADPKSTPLPMMVRP